ncbi:phosphoglycerate mutase [Fodinibius salinus]|uniref:Phosphoglycerate mutase n=1 Tax=Fodinibius salinus TaxID=860790 RepID=A0A5D3YJH3_9BACT|nr:alkaline phosphatase family protein [Fodinibius salinus]TYP93712.1 phosphoglycerate mutase [Fodinibius salinus]
MSLIFLFIDGVGLGEEGEANPFSRLSYPGFEKMAAGQSFTKDADEIIKNNHVFKQIDAVLGVEGLPQSGTGQTTLFSGENAAKKIGKHFGPFPHSGIKHLLTEQSLFSKAKRLGKKCGFINAYPDIFFEKAQKKNRWSCTTLMTKSAEIPLHTAEDVKNKKALTAGITQQAWRDHLNIDVPRISPENATDRLLNQSEYYDVLLYEYYLTDKAGHSQEHEKASNYLKTYDRFLNKLIKESPNDTTIILSSDHGNIEDLSVKTHTLNEVPLFVKGPGAAGFSNMGSIEELTPGILELLKKN